MFFLKSLVFTLFSPGFYKEAVGMGMKKAFFVFFLFSTIVTVVSTLYFFITFGSSLTHISDDLPDFPDIEISNGVLTTDPAKPYETTNGGQFLALDSTGTITEIPEEYNNGILLTANSIIIRNEDYSGDQEITYKQILDSFSKDSLSISKDGVASLIQKAGIVIMLISPVFIFIGQVLGTLFSVLTISILGLIILSMQGVEQAFRKSFILALYASIPVYYVSTIVWLLQKLFALAGISIPIGSLCCFIPIGFSLIKWGTFWGMGAWGITRKS
jgi:hypothetical protein